MSQFTALFTTGLEEINKSFIEKLKEVGYKQETMFNQFTKEHDPLPMFVKNLSLKDEQVLNQKRVIFHSKSNSITIDNFARLNDNREGKITFYFGNHPKNINELEVLFKLIDF